MQVTAGSIHTCAPAFYSTKEAARNLIVSASSHLIDVHLFGVGEQWAGFFTSKVIGLRKHLDMVSDEYTLVLDSSDTIVTAGPEDIMCSFANSVGYKRILIEADEYCFPHNSLKKRFDCTSPPNAIARYPCSGVIMGKTKDIVLALDKMVELRKECPLWMPGLDDDQGWWSICTIEDFCSIGIDYYSRLSFSMLRKKVSWYGFDGYRLILDGGTMPCILHFDGTRKWSRMDAYWKTVTGKGLQS